MLLIVVSFMFLGMFLQFDYSFFAEASIGSIVGGKVKVAPTECVRWFIIRNAAIIGDGLVLYICTLSLWEILF